MTDQTPQPSEQPRTAAGRALLDDLAYTRDNYLDPILAIEDEAGGAAIEEARMIASIEAEAAAPDPVASPRWEEWARRLAPLVHDGLIDAPNERQIIDKAFALARLLDEHLPDPVASPAPLDAPVRDALIAVGKAEQWDQVPSGTLRILKEAIEARLGQPVAEEPEG